MGKLSRLGRVVFLTASEEVLALRLAPVFSRIFETYVDPYDLCISTATGYWSHVKQDVMRFTGHYKPLRPVIDFGSWDLTVSYAAALPGVSVVDNRRLRVKDLDFEIVRTKHVGPNDVAYEVPKIAV